MRSVFVVALVGVVGSACGGSTSADSTGGSGGTTTTGGTGATGGGATGGTGALGGTAGTGNVGGTGAVGGTGGVAGLGPAPECTDASQCKIFDDCCTCAAYGPGEPTPTPCPAACKQSMCSMLGVSTQTLTCTAGRCVAGIACKPTDVFCNAMPPECEPGKLPSVVGGCWGPCVDSTQCESVSICTDCTGKLQTCVSIDTAGGDASGGSHCVSVPKGCEGNPTCSCMAPSVCLEPYSTCIDFSGLPGMMCSCPNC